MGKETNQNLASFNYFRGASSTDPGATLGHRPKADVFGPVPVRFSGLTADGATDDTTALNAIESGTLLVNQPVKIDGAAYLPESVTVVFAGTGKFVLGASATLTIEGAIRNETSGHIFEMATPTSAYDAQVRLRAAGNFGAMSGRLGDVDPAWWADDSRVLTGVSITALSKNLSASGGDFTSGDVGAWVRVPGALGYILKVNFTAPPSVLYRDSYLTFSGGHTGTVSSIVGSTVYVRAATGAPDPAETCIATGIGSIGTVSTAEILHSMDLVSSIKTVTSATAVVLQTAALVAVSEAAVTVGEDYGLQILKAIASCGDKATVRCPSGTFLARTPVPMDQNTWPTNIVIEGSGHIATTIIVAGNNGSKIFFQMGNGRESEIKNIRAIEEEGSREWALLQHGGTTCITRNCWFGNAKYGVIITNGAEVKFHSSTIEGCDIGIAVEKGNTLFTGFDGLYIIADGTIVDMSIYDVTIYLCNDVGVYAKIDDASIGEILDFRILDCEIKKCVNGGILVDNEKSNLQFAALRIESCGFFRNGTSTTGYGIKSIGNDIGVHGCTFMQNYDTGVIADDCEITMTDAMYYLQSTETDTANGGSFA